MSMLFPSRWPATRPDIIQLYSLATPNGQKVGIMLEETGLEYEAHKIDIMAGDQFDEEFKQLNPNSKIPALIDPNGPSGQSITFMESGAILMYLAEKTGRFLPSDPARRWETIQWLFLQVAHVGPMFGQFGHFFKFAREKTSDSYALERYTAEAKRILTVLDQRLQTREWIMGDDEMTIADIAIAPWIKALDFYEGHETLGTESFTQVIRYRDQFYARPNVQKGAAVCSL
ncbi:glutathione S-transferase N-terminal domain-containing protein [Gynuella sunshinyii]|uniref:Glutathione S-transferase n=1 Tax=Gynuella sunshinyii YC6258 TaxID=1445510 RepID=A0A0C5VQR9_9GAMM|nr:glutathione S-transferase N-terminal domain-containing protein [Gynuella sunshinyii]AJQ96606.1 glutathione S-transferase [Gynuella sunshinyii YC6258]